MTVSGVRRFAIGFFVLYAIAVIYPGVVPFRGPRPFVFGMPFAMAWAAAWVVASFFVLLLLDRAYSRALFESHEQSEGRDVHAADGGSSPGPESPATER